MKHSHLFLLIVLILSAGYNVYQDDKLIKLENAYDLLVAKSAEHVCVQRHAVISGQQSTQNITTKHVSVNWDDDIRNPENDEYVWEVAFNLDKGFKKVTQEDFNKRYCVDVISK